MNELREQYIELLRSTKREGMDSVIAFLCTSDFFTAPASTKYHSCHEGGLLEHSMNVFNLLKKKALDETNSLHTLVNWHKNSDSIIIAALLHDICKVNYYVSEPKNRKRYHEEGSKKDSLGCYDWETYIGYTVDDKSPLGHGEKSVIMLMPYIKLKKEELYAIRWHMGPGDGDWSCGKAFREYPLALALYEADLEATYLIEKEE